MSSTIINPNNRNYEGPDVYFNTNYRINENELFIELIIKFIPFDFRNYKWELFNNAVSEISISTSRTTLYTNNEKLNWIKNTIYNYIPFGFVTTNTPGLYNSFSSADFNEEIQTWEFSDYTHTYTIGRNASEKDIIEKNFIDKARTILSNRDDWYSTIFGQSFAFTYALNANKFFSFYKPTDKSSNFDRLLEQMNNSEAGLIQANLIWEQKAHDSLYNIVSIKAKTSFDSSVDNTFVVVAANPFSREIYTKFIPIQAVSTTPPQPQYQIEYVEDSIQMSNDMNKLGVECDGSVNNININIRKENSEDTGWHNLNPRISFKVREIQI